MSILYNNKVYCDNVLIKDTNGKRLNQLLEEKDEIINTLIKLLIDKKILKKNEIQDYIEAFKGLDKLVK